MQLPRAMARFNKRVTNRVQLRWAHVLPGYGILEHTGRKSGRAFRTPVNVFATPGGFVIPIAYGTQSDWVRNVLAAGGGHLVHRRVRYALRDPQVLTGGAGRPLLPRPFRALTKLVRAEDVLRVAAERV
jgi:deazaflavin-dependent oxidoreductase (nitroreductase family)